MQTLCPNMLSIQLIKEDHPCDGKETVQIGIETSA